MAPSTLRLAGKTALVTGVSRPRSIGFAVARQFAALGASVVVQHFAPHDEIQPWGGADLDAVRSGIRASLVGDARFDDIHADLADAATVAPLVERARSLSGRLEILACVHARSNPDSSIIGTSAELLSGHFDVNARATFLLTQAFASHFLETDGAANELATGRVFWMTSGQLHGAMPEEFAYVASKAALAGATASAASALLKRGIVLNTIDPGPVNTGYLDAETTDRAERLDELAAGLPFGRFGAPSDPARLIGWLASDDGRWMVGEVITSDGGYRLSR